MSNAQMQSSIEAALRAGYQVNVHAIGDAANRQVLDAFAAAYRSGRGQRTAQPDRARAGRRAVRTSRASSNSNLIASMQPTHATSDMNMAEERIGKARLEGAYAWRTFLKQGTRIAGGSDFPVESDNPFFGLHAAVTRTDHAGRPAAGGMPNRR